MPTAATTNDFVFGCGCGGGGLPFTENQEADRIAKYSKNSGHKGGNTREPELPLLHMLVLINIYQKNDYFDHLHPGDVRKCSTLWIDEGGQVENILPTFLGQVQTLESESNAMPQSKRSLCIDILNPQFIFDCN